MHGRERSDEERGDGGGSEAGGEGGEEVKGLRSPALEAREALLCDR